MKEKFSKLKIRTGVLVVLAMFLYACQDDQASFFYEIENDRGAIEFAMKWFAANNPDNTGLRSSDGEVIMFMRPDWENAFKTENDTYAVVEANVIMQDADRRKEKAQCNVRFVFRTALKTNETAGFFMKLLPNAVEESNVEHITYLDRGNFTGTILFRGMDGYLSHGWVYKEGVVTRTISPSQADVGEVHLRSSVGCVLVRFYAPRCPNSWWVYWNSARPMEEHWIRGETRELVYSHSEWVCEPPLPPGGGGVSPGGGDVRIVRNVSSFTMPWVDDVCLRLCMVFNLLAYLHQIVHGANHMTAYQFQRLYLDWGGTPPRRQNILGTSIRWIDMGLIEPLVHYAFRTRPPHFYTMTPPFNNPFLGYERAIADATAILEFDHALPQAVAIIGYRRSRELITIDGQGRLGTAMPGGAGVGSRRMYVRLAPPEFP